MNSIGRSAALSAAFSIGLIASQTAGAQDCPTAKSAASGYVIERQGGAKTDVLFSDDTTVRAIMRFEGRVLLETTQYQGLFEFDRISPLKP